MGLDSESVIKFLNNGGIVTIDELRKYLQKIEFNAAARGYRMCRIIMAEKNQTLRFKRERRDRQEFGQIMIDTADYIYQLRRLRNGQELEDEKEEGDRSDKRFQGKEKIKI